MNLKNILNSTLLATSLTLAPSITQAKEDTKTIVYQLVWNTIITTNSEWIKWVKTYDCMDYKWYKVYFSDKSNIIWSDDFNKISHKTVEEIKTSPKCKN